MFHAIANKIRLRWRSAVTGRFVSKLYAMLHKNTTVEETVRDEGDTL